MKFDDAKAAPIEQIKPGDQLRARGEKSADGDDFTAAEIVSGTFRNIAGTIISVDQATKTISVNDLIGKKAMVVKISDESQLKKLSPEMAQRIAMRFRVAARSGGWWRSGSGAGLAQSGAAPAGGANGGGGSAAGGSAAGGGAAEWRRGGGRVAAGGQIFSDW